MNRIATLSLHKRFHQPLFKSNNSMLRQFFGKRTVTSSSSTGTDVAAIKEAILKETSTHEVRRLKNCGFGLLK